LQGAYIVLRDSGLIDRLLEGFWSVLYATAIAALIVALLLAMLFTTGPLMIIIVGIACSVAGHYRRSRQRVLLTLLRNAVQRQIPLERALEAIGREYGPRYQHRVQRLERLLAGGTPLADALRLVPRLVPTDCLPLLHAGARANRLGEALERIAQRDSRDEMLALWISGRLYYLALVLLFGIGTWMFMAIKIVPAFARIFEEFGMRLPDLTRAAIAITKFTIDYGAFPLAIVCLLILLYLYGLSRHAQLARWVLPGTGWITRRLDTAIVLDTLGLVAEARLPLTDGLSSLAMAYPRGPMGRRLWRLWGDVAGGREWSTALRARLGMPRGEAALLESAARSGNLSWALREMARNNRRRYYCRMQAAIQIVFPVALLGLGLLVGFYVVAFFLPLVSLIHALA
jgi:type IV pilus assembly protein PilC